MKNGLIHEEIFDRQGLRMEVESSYMRMRVPMAEIKKYDKI